MCGIFGVVGSATPVQDVMDGLQRLEYRGYDSAGVATVANGGLEIRRRPGKLSALRDLLAQNPMPAGSETAIGHTRWATHGEPNETNAHPHQAGSCAVVHNGIIENYQEIRAELMAEGHVFSSETDTEVLPALISKYLQDSASELDAVIKTMHRVEGAFALGIVFADQPDQLIAARRGSPLLIGVGHGKTPSNYIGSDAIAMAPFTNRVMYLENDDVAVVTSTQVNVFNAAGEAVTRPVKTVDVSSVLAGKNGYRHFMLKEIHEQPTVIGQTLSAYLTADRKGLQLPELPFDWRTLPQFNIVACGTSSYAAMVARYWFEELAHLPVNVDIASEFRYRNPPLVDGGLSLFISQSGETADTMACLELSKERKQHILSVVNVPTSSMARASDAVVPTLAGPEVGVASTKAFTTQLVVLALLAIDAGLARKTLSADAAAELIHALAEVPARLTSILDQEGALKTIAAEIMHATSALYLGRGSLYPIALEGALKLKEISYIHAEGYAAGEMKHGPIALIDENMPVITLAAGDSLFEKTLSNMREAEARKGRVYLIADKKAAQQAGTVNGGMFTIPDAHPFVTPLLETIPMQLLAYHVAVLKGTDVDQPRNLAKSVTVE